MKLAIGIAVISTALGLGAGLSGRAMAQEAAAGGGVAKPGSTNDDTGTTYKAKTVYDFEDDMVEGDLQRPDGELVNSLGKTQHSSLIEIRKDFIPEMLKSLEDV